LVVQARLWGPAGDGALLLALDTAATITLIKPQVLRRFGYDERSYVRKTSISSAIGAEPGHELDVERLSTLGNSAMPFTVHAHELPEQYDIDGLLGLNFLDHFDYTIYSLRDQIAVEPAMPR
jgi:hypothetical protein